MFEKWIGGLSIDFETYSKSVASDVKPELPLLRIKSMMAEHRDTETIKTVTIGTTTRWREQLSQNIESFDEAHLRAVSKSYDAKMQKLLRNSLYGTPVSNFTDEPVFTAELSHTNERYLPHRVKIRCPNWNKVNPLYPSESHACEKYAHHTVKPWLENNCANAFLRTSYSVFAFADEVDASLCYMRFK